MTKEVRDIACKAGLIPKLSNVKYFPQNCLCNILGLYSITHIVLCNILGLCDIVLNYTNNAIRNI